MTGTSSLTVNLHPLPLLNITDVCTRNKLNNQKGLGIILGTQDAKNITIVNSFEIMVDNDYNVDKGYLTDRIEQFRIIYPEQELIGWYEIIDSANDSKIINENDTLNIYKQLEVFNESLFLLIFDLNQLKNQNKLPIKIYELRTQSENQKNFQNYNENKLIFLELKIKIDSKKVENISINDILNSKNLIKNNDEILKSLKNQLKTNLNSLFILDKKIEIILNYLNDIELKKIDGNFEILRNISNLLTILNNDVGDEKVVNEMIDKQLNAQASSILALLIDGIKDLEQMHIIKNYLIQY